MAKTTPSAASSTERRAEPLVPRAWDFEGALGEAARAFAREAGIRAADDARLRAAILSHLDDRDRIRETLRRLPALHVVVLEVLAELGGRLTVEILTDRVRARTRCDGEAVAAAARDLDARMLTAPLATKPARGAGVPVVALLAPAAKHVAALVRGVSLPAPEPPPDARPAAAAPLGRDTVAIAGLTAHRPLRFNFDGGPHGSQIGRFGKDLAPPDVRLDRLIEEARSLGLLGAIGDTYAPLAGALLRFARSIDEELAAWLPAAGWAPVEAVVRARARRRVDARGAGVDLGTLGHFHELLDDVTRRTKGARGVEIVEAGGEAWMRRRAEGSGGGDGHVTPSFEVMLGPRADLEIVAAVSLGCELVRLDRVLTFRITPASVRAGLSSGLSAAELLGALDRVGRHPLPANVRTMVDDWIARQRAAGLMRAWVVRVPAEVADSLAASDLAQCILERLAPDLLALDPAIPRAQIMKHLSKHGVSLGPPISLEEALANRGEERWGPEGSYWTRRMKEEAKAPPAPEPLPPPLPLSFEGDPVLAKEVAAARSAGFPALSTPREGEAPRRPASPGTALRPHAATHASIAAPQPSARAPVSPREAMVDAIPDAQPSARSSANVDAMLSEARALGLAPDLLAGLSSLGVMYVEELPELERWAARLPPAAREPVKAALESPLALAAFLVLAPKARQSVIAKSNDLDRLFQESIRSRGYNRVSPRGAAAMHSIAEATRSIEARRAARGKAPESRAAPEGSPRSEPPAARRAPLPAEFPRQSGSEVLDALRAACAASELVRLLVRSGGDTVVHAVVASAIQPRGKANAFLAIDPETDEGRVYHVPDVLAVVRPSP